ncbi:hypothetical protein O3G_MSEX011083 [Manduca sexta]|uniref:Uncharacterized protein n=1 Tax=Manduca sexta TaxID=7130 RepID=A0A921ZJR5_MANSE|nr:hypothetical protein O3G_MSEX011083 [Manduca sexta]
MEVIEDGNIMDRIPILLQRDLEYYQKNQTVLSETVCRGVVGGRLDFPRNASFAAVKIVLWLEEEFSIAFKQGSGMFVGTEEDEKTEGGVAKTSDPDKFVQLAIKSSDSLLEHLHMLVQEALDHADLPVLTAALGAAALLKNSLYCYVQHVEDMGNHERHSLLQACYKRYVTMAEAVGERVLDLHNRVLSLYILQDSGGRPIDGQTRCAHAAGTPSIQGWWLYMNGSRKDLWDTVPPRMAQRIFAGMLNETLTILTVRYCQTITTETTTPLLLNDIVNVLQCVAQLLPSICTNGSDLAGLDVSHQTRDVRDVHSKCNELFKCLVYRGAELHFVHQAFTEADQDANTKKESPYPWYTFVSPKLFDNPFDDASVRSSQDLPTKTALGLELIVLLAQPQPSWALVVKVLMMRDCHLIRMLLIRALRYMSVDNHRWAADGLWYSMDTNKCGGFLCTVDGFCKFKGDSDGGQELARAAGALTYVLASIGSKAEFKSTLCYALEISGRDWAACLDKRQVWCDRRPPWLAGLLAMVGSALQFIPPILVNALQSGASMYQTMSLCLTCMLRTMDCIPRAFINACTIIESSLPTHVNPVGGSVLIQMLVIITYEEIQKFAKLEAAKEALAASSINGEPHGTTPKSKSKTKHVRIVGFGQTTSSSSMEGSSACAVCAGEALTALDEDHKHTRLLQLLATTATTSRPTQDLGLADYPEFAELFQEGDVPGANAERASDAAALTSQILMTAPGRDSLRVIYTHLQLHSEWIYKELGIQESCDVDIPLNRAPLLYIMFHIGRQPFDQVLSIPKGVNRVSGTPNFRCVVVSCYRGRGNRHIGDRFQTPG